MGDSSQCRLDARSDDERQKSRRCETQRGETVGGARQKNKMSRQTASIAMLLAIGCNQKYHAAMEENKRLRAIFPKILAALESGGCSPNCSIEFLEEIPREVRLVVKKLKSVI